MPLYLLTSSTSLHIIRDGIGVIGVQSNGKIVQAATVWFNGNQYMSSISHFGLMRFNPDGSLDSSFGTNGKIITQFMSTEGASPQSLIIQPDDKIIVAGSYQPGSSNDYGFAFVCYNPDGSLDSSFGTGGKITYLYNADNMPRSVGTNSMVIQNDGKILVAGGPYILRLNSNGTRDTSFGNTNNGLSAAAFSPQTEYTSISMIKVQNDGKIVVAGSTGDSYSESPYLDFTVARFNSNGTLDSSFGNGGNVISDFGNIEQAYSLIIQNDGKIVLGGRSFDPNWTWAKSLLVRYNPDGSLDSSFGTNGKVDTAYNGYPLGGSYRLLLQPDGKIISVDAPSDIDGIEDFGLTRYNSNGSIDTSFGTNGQTTTDTGGDEYPSDATLLSSGKILVGGTIFGLHDYDTGASIGLAQFIGTQPNTAPIINSIPNAEKKEGETYSYTGSFTDPDSTSWTGKVDYGDGSGEHDFTAPNESLDPVNHTFTISHVYKDNSATPYVVTVKLTDNQGATSEPKSANITVNNVAPTLGAITASVNPIQVNTSTTASATFTDPGVLDTHTATWDWGDGNTTTGTVTETNGSGSVSDSHTYTSAGVYPITLTVTDKDGGQGSQIFQYLSVYNPTASSKFVAGQIYNSPAGAYLANTSLTGNVKFGMVYKYQGDIPNGERQFSMDFNAANLHFNATTISLLVIVNGIGTLTGTGTFSGNSTLTGTYNFLVTGSESANTIRIKITDPANNNTVIYDTQPGAADNATPTTTVTAGNVLAH